MSSKPSKSKLRKTKKKTSSNKERMNHIPQTPSCLRGDDFHIEAWLDSSNQETDKLSSQMLPTRAAAIKAKNGLSNQGGFVSSYDAAKEKDPRSVINEQRLFYEEYVQPFKCIQLFNQANLEVLAYKLHTISQDMEQEE